MHRRTARARGDSAEATAQAYRSACRRATLRQRRRAPSRAERKRATATTARERRSSPPPAHGRQHGADAEAIRIPGGEHGDRLAAMSENRRDRLGDWARPGHPLTARQAVSKARCRLPPITSLALAMSARAAGESPSAPSSPMPTMASHRAVDRPRSQCDLVSGMTPLKLLILGGSGEAADLARALERRRAFRRDAVARRRTAEPMPASRQTASGGFGGAEGLRAFSPASASICVVDATHPFAVQIKANAIKAAHAAGVPLLAIHRPALDAARRRRLDHGRRARGRRRCARRDTQARVSHHRPPELAPFRAAPQHFYMLRSVETPSPAELPPRVALITARGPFKSRTSGTAQEQCIETIVTKNSGGEATKAKLEAARALDLPVIMVGDRSCRTHRRRDRRRRACLAGGASWLDQLGVTRRVDKASTIAQWR